MPTRTQAHEGGTNVTIHIGIQFLVLHLEYAFYNVIALLQPPDPAPVFGDEPSFPPPLLKPVLMYLSLQQQGRAAGGRLRGGTHGGRERTWGGNCNRTDLSFSSDHLTNNKHNRLSRLFRPRGSPGLLLIYLRLLARAVEQDQLNL
jgi:hypothetical protein